MSRRTFAARRRRILSAAERLERHRRNLANLRGGKSRGQTSNAQQRTEERKGGGQ